MIAVFFENFCLSELYSRELKSYSSPEGKKHMPGLVVLRALEDLGELPEGALRLCALSVQFACAWLPSLRS